MRIINKEKKTVKEIDPHYKELCDEAFINLNDAIKMKFTEDDLLRFIIKTGKEI